MSTAALSYTLGLRHALDADHISVSRILSYFRLVHSLMRLAIADRSDDPQASSRRAETGDCRNLLQSRTFNVSFRSRVSNNAFVIYQDVGILQDRNHYLNRRCSHHSVHLRPLRLLLSSWRDYRDFGFRGIPNFPRRYEWLDIVQARQPDASSDPR